MNKHFFWTLALAITPIWGFCNDGWSRYETVSDCSCKVSYNSVRNILEQGLGSVRFKRLNSWNGPSENGYADGPGRVEVMIVIAEAGGFKKFHRKVTLEGVMKKGHFFSEVRINVEDPYLFDRHMNVLYSDGFINFVSKEEFDAQMGAMNRQLSKLGLDVIRLNAQNEEQQKLILKKKLEQLENDNPEPEVKSWLARIKTLYFTAQAPIDRVLKDIINVALKKIGKPLLKSNPYTRVAYALYFIASRFFFGD